MTCHQHHPINITISSPEAIDELATELANDYVEYFNIDIKQEQTRYLESIDECLAHLEEVISSLDSYKQRNDIIDTCVQTLSSKKEPLGKLYAQVDALEQYVFEANRVLDKLELAVKDFESHRSFGQGRIQQILDFIPANLPRFKLFNSLTRIIDNSRPQILEQAGTSDGNIKQLIPISEILNKIPQIEIDMDNVIKSTYKRLNIEPDNRSIEHDDPTQPIAALSLDSTTENVDNSWQELL